MKLTNGQLVVIWIVAMLMSFVFLAMGQALYEYGGGTPGSVFVGFGVPVLLFGACAWITVSRKKDDRS